MSLTPHNVIPNPGRCLLAKHQDRWRIFYVKSGKLFQRRCSPADKFNEIAERASSMIKDNPLLRLQDWDEIRDWSIPHGLEFFRLTGGMRIDNAELIGDLTQFNEAPNAPAQPGDVGPDADLSDASLADLYPKYYKRIPTSWKVIDVYGVHSLFPIEDFSGAIHHSSKKLLVPGVRTGGKSMRKDIVEARDTLNRWLELNPEVADEPINQ